jgi:cytochrome P450
MNYYASGFRKMLLPPCDIALTSFRWSIICRFWHAGHEPFRRAESDTFMLTHTSGNMLLTCDPCVAQDILARSDVFKGAAETLKIYNIYGPTLASCEDEDWKRYRKVLMPYFSTATNAVMLKEALAQTEAMLATWSDGQVLGDVKNQLAARLTIGVIAQAFFGKPVAMQDYDSQGRKGSRHTSFGKAILNVNEALSLIVPLQAVPSWFRGE